MRITLATTTLAEILDMSTRFIAKSSTLPILQNIYLHVQDNELTVKATDMEKFIHMTLPLDKAEDGGITVDAKTLHDIVRVIEDDNIELSVNNQTDMLTIQSAKDSFTIKGIPTGEFVALPELTPTHTSTIPVQDLVHGIGKVEFAVLEKNFSPIFTGVVIASKIDTADKHYLVFVGTDSFRLAEYKVAVEKRFTDEFKIIIPKVAANDIKKVGEYCMSKQQSNSVVVAHANNMVSCTFTIGTMNIVTNSLLIQGTFPDYDNEKIVPREFNTSITVDASSADKAIRKIGIMTKDINNFIHIVSDANTLSISSGNTDLGNADTSIAAIIEGEAIDMGLNGKHLSEFMKIVSSDRVVMQFVNNTSPFVITEPDNPHYKYVLRPVK